MEHDRHTLTFFTHQITDALIVRTEVQCTGGVAVDTHFAFDIAALHIIGFSEFALFIESDFGNHENGNALCSLGVAFDSGQNRMDDVRGQIMVAGGNEALGADDGVGAISILFGGCLQSSDVRTGARLRQTHRSRPFAGVHFFQNDVAQRMLEEIFHQSCTTVGKTGIHNKSLIAGQKHICCGSGNDSGESLSADFRLVSHSHVTVFAIKLP